MEARTAALLSTLLLLSGCGGTRRADSEGGGAGGETCSHPDWGPYVDACRATELEQFLSTAEELSGVAASQVEAVTTACREIAMGLGATMDAVPVTDAAGRVQGWCHVAATEIQAEITSNGKIHVSAQPVTCAYGAAQMACEAACSGKLECASTDIVGRCLEAALSGTCSGTCSGSCAGAAGAPIACAGLCKGACTGTCDGAASTKGACTGNCVGSCEGSCTDQLAGGKCDGACTGGCSGDLVSPFCHTSLTSPADLCQGCGGCGALCRTEDVMKATCQPPGLGITADPTIAPSTVELLREHLTGLQRTSGVELYRAAADLHLFAEVIYSPGELPPSSAFASKCIDDGEAHVVAIADELYTSWKAAEEVAGSFSMP